MERCIAAPHQLLRIALRQIRQHSGRSSKIGNKPAVRPGHSGTVLRRQPAVNDMGRTIEPRIRQRGDFVQSRPVETARMGQIKPDARPTSGNLQDVRHRRPGIPGMNTGMDEHRPVFFLRQIEQTLTAAQQVFDEGTNHGGLNLQARTAELLMERPQGFALTPGLTRRVQHPERQRAMGKLRKKFLDFGHQAPVLIGVRNFLPRPLSGETPLPRLRQVEPEVGHHGKDHELSDAGLGPLLHQRRPVQPVRKMPPQVDRQVHPDMRVRVNQLRIQSVRHDGEEEIFCLMK